MNQETLVYIEEVLAKIKSTNNLFGVGEWVILASAAGLILKFLDSISINPLLIYKTNYPLAIGLASIVMMLIYSTVNIYNNLFVVKSQIKDNLIDNINDLSLLKNFWFIIFMYTSLFFSLIGLISSGNDISYFMFFEIIVVCYLLFKFCKKKKAFKYFRLDCYYIIPPYLQGEYELNYFESFVIWINSALVLVVVFRWFDIQKETIESMVYIVSIVLITCIYIQADFIRKSIINSIEEYVEEGDNTAYNYIVPGDELDRIYSDSDMQIYIVKFLSGKLNVIDWFFHTENIFRGVRLGFRDAFKSQKYSEKELILMSEELLGKLTTFINVFKNTALYKKHKDKYYEYVSYILEEFEGIKEDVMKINP